MKKITKFTDLQAWKAAHKLRIMVLKEIKNFPIEYQFGLSAQLQRSAISVGSNIAEGFGRSTMKERTRFYVIAKASLIEVQDQTIVARDMNLVTERDFKIIINQSITTHKIINGLIRSTRSLGSRSQTRDSK